MIDEKSGRLWRTDGDYGVTLDRTFPIPVAALWDWVTDPDRLASWYCPVTGTLAPGGEYQMHFGEETGTGIIQLCDAPSSYTATWNHVGEPASLLAVTLHAVDPGQSRIVLEHRQLPANQAAGHAAGWHSYLDRLEAAASGGVPPEWWPRWEDVIDSYRSQHRALTV